MDEPTTGIDVASAGGIRQLISDLNSGEGTIFLTTHYIEEAERLCRRIAFIASGKIVRTDTMENLMRLTEGHYAVQFAVSNNTESLMKRFKNLGIDYLAGILCEELNETAPRPPDSFRLPIHYEAA